MATAVPTLEQCAPIVTLSIISFLSYPSQWLFANIEPGPLDTREAIRFNILLACIYICYLRTWLLDPGRVPKDWHVPESQQGAEDGHSLSQHGTSKPRVRWCRRCDNHKPPRAHHCKICQRCIPKMDHHCPWSATCISYRTLPHFTRFLVFSVIAISQLQYNLAIRILVIWHARDLPSYLGPAPLHLALLLILALLNTMVFIGMTLLMLRTLWTVGSNTTAIESWEIERHAVLVRRARLTGGLLAGPDGEEICIVHQEFPWDIGIYSNISQGMGSKNPLVWLWPLASSLPVSGGLAFPDNGLEDENTSWPPPDPDRMATRNKRNALIDAKPFVHDLDIAAFRRRQEADFLRYRHTSTANSRVQHRRVEENADAYGQYDYQGTEAGRLNESPIDDSAAHGPWRNAEGESLGDFGVDEDEVNGDDDVPLAEILKRDKPQASSSSSYIE